MNTFSAFQHYLALLIFILRPVHYRSHIFTNAEELI